jgi:hypothetical protein
VVGAAAGAAALAYGLYVGARAFTDVPESIVAAIAFSGAGVISLTPKGGVVGSPWRIPQEWSRFGPVPYAALFGLTLGFGVFTSFPSLGFFVLVAAALTIESWSQIFAIFLVFTLMRLLPVPVVALASARDGRPHHAFRSFTSVSARLRWVEFLLMAFVGLAFLL